MARELLEDRRRDAERRRDDDQLVRQLVGLPVGAMRAGLERAGRVRDFDAVALGVQELDEPAAHLAAPADHQRAPSRTLPLRRELRLLLGRERAANQETQEVVGQRGRKAELLRGHARVHQHVALALEVARRVAGCTLGARHLLGQPLALGDECEQFAIESGQPFAQLGKIHAGSFRQTPPCVPARLRSRKRAGVFSLSLKSRNRSTSRRAGRCDQ